MAGTDDLSEPAKLRDSTLLTEKDLFADYAARASKTSGTAARATAIRTEASGYEEALAFGATNGHSLADLLAALTPQGVSGDFTISNAQMLGELGALLIMREPVRNDDGEKILTEACRLLPANQQSIAFRRLLLQYKITNGRYREAHELLSTWPDLRRSHYGYLETDLLNPFLEHASPYANFDLWLERFNGFFLDHNLSEVHVDPQAGVPFDGLESASSAPVDRGTRPAVSVIMTTWKPREGALLTSVESILRQSFQDIELIIVDDGSSAEHKELLEAVAERDSRIRLILKDENLGTYPSRNVGIQEARGEFITGQDQDDWAHPDRISEQVKALRSAPMIPACKVRAVSCNNDLRLTRVGYTTPVVPNASSLMFRREIVNRIGGYLPIRKAADTELEKRIEVVTGSEIFEVRKPLSIIRIEDDSLSRGDFRAGWSHPARRYFKSAYALWHAESPREGLYVGETLPPNLAVPRRFLSNTPTDPAEFDVVLAGDWHQYGGPQKSMIEEISALKRAGMGVAILHMEAGRFMSSRSRHLCAPIQRLINDGSVEQVFYDDPVSAKLLSLRYPPILQFPHLHASAIQSDNMIIVANQAPSERDGSDVRYLPQECDANAKAMFGRAPLWAPQGPQVREALEPFTDSIDLAPFNMPGIIAAEEWHVDRTHRRSLIPVAGRHSRDNGMKWPSTTTDIKSAYPTDGSVDVRILGGATSALEVLGQSRVPAAWTVFSTDEVPVKAFLDSLDYYVHFPHGASYEAFGRSVLEALASGLVTILPPVFEPVFGKGAAYCHPAEVRSVLRSFQENEELYNAQSRRALEEVESQFSYNSYVSLIQQIMSGSATRPAKDLAIQ